LAEVTAKQKPTDKKEIYVKEKSLNYIIKKKS